MFFLRPHSSNKGEISAPSVQVLSDGEFLNISFHLREYTDPYADPSFDKGWRNWGLWEKDVFEAFLVRGAELPYLELQVSPLGQRFALLISKPRKEFDYPERDVFEGSSIVDESGWKALMRVPLANIPGRGELRANFHSIVGKSREHFSWSPNPERSPDFHRPELFLPLEDA